MEWSTGRSAQACFSWLCSLHECTLWTHTDSCDRPHERSHHPEEEGLWPALLWKLKRVVSGHFPSSYFQKCAGDRYQSWHRMSPGMSGDRADHEFIWCQAWGPRTSTPPRGRVSQPHSSRGAPQTHPPAHILGLQEGGQVMKDHSTKLLPVQKATLECNSFVNLKNEEEEKHCDFICLLIWALG